MRIIIDCCLTRNWVEFLSAEGHDATYWRTIGAPDAPDVEIAAWAAEHQAVVLTQDLDFGDILATQQLTAPSVIQIRAEAPSPEYVGTMVLRVLVNFSAQLLHGAIATVYADRAKIRLLPLT